MTNVADEIQETMMNNSGIFNINTLENILFLGSSANIYTLYKSAEQLGLRVGTVTSAAQAKELEGRVPFTVFQKLDDKFAEFVAQEYPAENTLFVSLGARWIFTEKMIDDLFCGHLVNFHGSRLPLDAGGGGFSWRILRKDRIDNQLVHLIDSGVDTGAIIDSKSSPFPATCIVPADFESQYQQNLESFFLDFVKQLKEGKKFQLKRQVNYIGSYNPRLLTDINGWIDWSWSADQIADFIHAFDSPYQGASTTINNQKVKIKKVQLHGGDQTAHPYMSGLLFRKHDGWILVSISDTHSLLIECVENESGDNIINDLEVGDRFCTTSEQLHDAKSTRVRFGPDGSFVK